MTQPTQRGRMTQAAIDAAARAVIARKGILATTVSDIATEGRQVDRVLLQLLRLQGVDGPRMGAALPDEANERAKAVTRHGISDRERVHEAAAAHWYTYRHRLAEMISVSQLAMVNADFAQYWSELCSIPISFITDMVRRAQADGHCVDDDPHLLAQAIVAMLNQFCYLQLAEDSAEPDDDACIATLSNIFYRAIFSKENP